LRPPTADRAAPPRGTDAFTAPALSIGARPMAALAHELKASYAFIERNFFLSRRYWGWEIAFLVYSAAGALSISLIGAEAGDPRLLLTLMVGAIFWNYLSVVFSWIAETIQIERWEGTLEYTMMAPIRRSTHLLGAVAYAMLFGLVHTAAILVAVVLFFPDISYANANFGTVGAFMVLGSFSFVGLAMMVAILPLLFVERGGQMAFTMQSVLLLVSGVYYSIDVLPGWMQAISHFSPATYALDGVRKGLIDGVPLSQLGGDIWPLLVMGTLFIPFGLWAFSAAERYAKRTGKLKRVG
jgi:ABC-2 type transport system permease protein